MRAVRRFLDRRRKRRIAQQVEDFIWALDAVPAVRKAVRRALRVKGYEG